MTYAFDIGTEARPCALAARLNHARSCRAENGDAGDELLRARGRSRPTDRQRRCSRHGRRRGDVRRLHRRVDDRGIRHVHDPLERQQQGPHRGVHRGRVGSRRRGGCHQGRLLARQHHAHRTEPDVHAPRSIRRPAPSPALRPTPASLSAALPRPPVRRASVHRHRPGRLERHDRLRVPVGGDLLERSRRRRHLLLRQRLAERLALHRRPRAAQRQLDLPEWRHAHRRPLRAERHRHPEHRVCHQRRHLRERQRREHLAGLACPRTRHA